MMRSMGHRLLGVSHGVAWTGGNWHETMVLTCLPAPAPSGLSPLYFRPSVGPYVVWLSTEALDDLSWLTTPESAVPETGCCPCR